MRPTVPACLPDFRHSGHVAVAAAAAAVGEWTGGGSVARGGEERGRKRMQDM